MSQAQHHSASSPTSQRAVSRSRHVLRVVEPYRLDLTVSALRPLSTNVVDLLTPTGQYVRALEGVRTPIVVRVMQRRPDALALTLQGERSEHRRALALVRRMLGVDRDLTHFQQAAARIAWLRPLALRMRGVKPPRYPTLWEACVNVIVFQQVSLLAASTILRRVIIALSPALESAGVTLYPFPSAERFLSAEDSALRAAGLSQAKLATLRRVGEALAVGALSEAVLEKRASPDAAALLRKIKGIGPWSAAVILLRGLGRLDVFPTRDTSVAHNLALVSGAAPLDMDAVLAALRPQQGMLYYYLLLARLEARGDVGRASVPGARPAGAR